MDERKRAPLNQLLASLAPGIMVDAAWLQAQGISRTSIHDYVQRGWLERIAPRVYRRATTTGAGNLRWDIAVISAQRIGTPTFYIGGLTTLDLLGQGHFARLGSERSVELYDPEGTAPSWLLKLMTDATLVVHKRKVFSDPDLGLEWRRLDPGTARLGGVVPAPTPQEPWDHFMRIAGAERAAIEMMDDVARTLSFEHADSLFEGLTMLRPRLLANLLEGCSSVRAKRLFLFYADRHNHSWAKHLERRNIDLGRGKRQLATGGRLDTLYQITVPADFVRVPESTAS